ncbi:hypothetical protein Dsin_017356 [Dipteronia sinensis]|uniref:DUF4283 domain-containing protein n=1 Tax=Dipteronia sinensis TaxID=43782 RepID=A0AAE0AGA4_9ROSI|nr:hypothetical protein Dsin_017356 [Dipteronia sinensis]
MLSLNTLWVFLLILGGLPLLRSVLRLLVMTIERLQTSSDDGGAIDADGQMMEVRFWIKWFVESGGKGSYEQEGEWSGFYGSNFKIWKVREGVEIEMVSNNVFAFQTANLCANLSLLEEKGLVRLLQDDLNEVGLRWLALSLVGKVLTNKKVNGVAFMGLISKFGSGPWTFDSALIVLAEPTGKLSVDKMVFSDTEFWVQIHKVSLLCMTKEIGRFLGSMVEEVKEVEIGKSWDNSKNFLRVRLRMDIMRPLRRFLRVDVMGYGDVSVMLLWYEWLPNHCFRCATALERWRGQRRSNSEKLNSGISNHFRVGNSGSRSWRPVVTHRPGAIIGSKGRAGFERKDVGRYKRSDSQVEY